MTRTTIEQADGTLWLCCDTYWPRQRNVPGREYWVSYLNGPATIMPGRVVGFYASSMEDAHKKLGLA
jgi:hypothetical protein